MFLSLKIETATLRSSNFFDCLFTQGALLTSLLVTAGVKVLSPFGQGKKSPSCYTASGEGTKVEKTKALQEG